jgi:predicted Rossmann-fold nucleotide-binding protein
VARKSKRYPSRIISGGQTGVDRAALDVALELGIPCGGWCPLGRRAEDGRLPERYPLQETPTADYAERTEWNVRDSDGTLVLLRGEPSGGTALTIELARKHKKPCLVVNVGDAAKVEDVCTWLGEQRIQVLNVAGPRESNEAGVYGQAETFLRSVFRLPR